MNTIKALRDLDRADLATAGGKGANLGALIQAGLPVPPGFCITTGGYRAFVAANRLDMDLRRILAATQMDNPASLEAASDAIRACFQQGVMPPDLAEEIRQAYTQMQATAIPVAVRSSATAEDLPDLSFAGQQDTYLNILGADALLDAVIRCWASLWTGRAIGYRARNAIAHEDVFLAVVVQQMVQSEASGVLFTANPLTGKRSETVIDATLGLGEALVSGQVEPDHYLVDSASGTILSKTLGAKALSIQGQAGGGTVTLHNPAADRQALPDEHITALTRLGQRSQAYFGSPQDMEWAWADGKMYIVQSRPVTSLFPLPEGLTEQPLKVMFSFGVWQGMLDPYTPIGQDVFSIMVVGFGRLFGLEIKPQEQRALFTSAERIFVNLTGMLRNPLGRSVLSVFIPSVDPISGDILTKLLKEPRLSAVSNFSLRNRLRLARLIVPLFGSVFYNWLWPARGRARLEAKIASSLAETQSDCQAAQNLPALLEAIESLAAQMPPKMMPHLVGAIAAGQGPYQILLRQPKNFENSTELLMGITRGLPHNVTTQMDLALWQTAQAIRADASATDYFSTTEIETLVSEYRQGELPAAAQTAITRFLAQYGMRGVGEIDLGRPRWREDPTSIFQVLKSYLQIAPEASPQEMFRRGAEKAQAAQKQLVEAYRQLPGGFFKAQLIKAIIYRFRELGGLRESPKFFIIRLMGHYRTALLAAGQKLVEAGTLEAPEDVFFLHSWELKALGNGAAGDWKAQVVERRATYTRELRRRRIPRILLSDGTAYYDAPAAPGGDDPNHLCGSPVSAGVVEGAVRVVLNPHGVQLVPGEILVCPATDPAWTPLFLAAGGLVMEVGGMVTHGSVVAREYGIPAVVGVSQATSRLHDGQRVRVDGSNGVITLLDSQENTQPPG